MLAAVLLPDTRADLSDPLGELGALVESAGGTVVDALIQKRTRFTAAFALGKGKVAELRERADAAEADTIVFDHELSPRQIRGLERQVERKIIDRSELILDIFAARARTRAAQLQVELAQLEYTAPRLRGLWTHLERIAGAGGATGAGVVGGIGTRGPGERQIEIDRRLVRDRITLLKRQIDEIDRRKQREVRARRDEYLVSLVGYTNSGKTTLLNKLTGSERYVADKLFSTLDTKTVRWSLGEGRQVLLSDTVGFVRDLPHHLVASFRATLEETLHADMLLHVVDASSPTALAQIEAVDQVLDSLDCHDRSRFLVLNKMDVVTDPGVPDALGVRAPDALRVSALTGMGLEELRQRIERSMDASSVTRIVRIPHAEGKLLAELSTCAEVMNRHYSAEHVELKIRIDPPQLQRLAAHHPTMIVVDPVEDDAHDDDPV